MPTVRSQLGAQFLEIGLFVQDVLLDMYGETTDVGQQLFLVCDIRTGTYRFKALALLGVVGREALHSVEIRL